jgi:hypothetical protein
MVDEELATSELEERGRRREMKAGVWQTADERRASTMFWGPPTPVLRSDWLLTM